MNTCANCRFWKRWTHQPDGQHPAHYGDCRRRAPICHPGALPNMAKTKWPSTSSQDSCGEHERNQP